VQFLYTAEAQTIFAQHGLRAVDAAVAQATAAQYPPVTDLFTIEYFGGWDRATPDYFGDAGVYTQAASQVQAP
jgi:sulfate transport system substrate-binding protein